MKMNTLKWSIVIVAILTCIQLYRVSSRQIVGTLNMNGNENDLKTVLQDFHHQALQIANPPTFNNRSIFTPPQQHTHAAPTLQTLPSSASMIVVPVVSRPAFKLKGIMPGDHPVAILEFQGKSQVVEAGQEIWGCKVNEVLQDKLMVSCQGTSFEYAP